MCVWHLLSQASPVQGAGCHVCLTPASGVWGGGIKGHSIEIRVEERRAIFPPYPHNTGHIVFRSPTHHVHSEKAPTPGRLPLYDTLFFTQVTLNDR